MVVTTSSVKGLGSNLILPVDINMGEAAFNALMVDSTHILHREPNVLQLADPLTVIGDLHGQFNDLLKIFELTNEIAPSSKAVELRFPSGTARRRLFFNPRNVGRMLFLGDYVNRANEGLEVLITLLVLKQSFPNNIYLLRGNHETRSMTSSYNFASQCIKRYSSASYLKCMKMMDALPIAAVINSTFFAVHGGISPKLHKIDALSRINRFIEPPPDGLFSDIIWADPRIGTHLVQFNSVQPDLGDILEYPDLSDRNIILKKKVSNNKQELIGPFPELVTDLLGPEVNKALGITTVTSKNPVSVNSSSCNSTNDDNSVANVSKAAIRTAKSISTGSKYHSLTQSMPKQTASGNISSRSASNQSDVSTNSKCSVKSRESSGSRNSSHSRASTHTRKSTQSRASSRASSLSYMTASTRWSISKTVASSNKQLSVQKDQKQVDDSVLLPTISEDITTPVDLADPFVYRYLHGLNNIIDTETTVEQEPIFLANLHRNRSFYFNEAATNVFLKTNKLLSVIRAHEPTMAGYTMHGQSKFPPVITVFSAPQYCGMANMGALLHITGNNVHVIQFHANTMKTAPKLCLPIKHCIAHVPSGTGAATRAWFITVRNEASSGNTSRLVYKGANPRNRDTINKINRSESQQSSNKQSVVGSRLSHPRSLCRNDSNSCSSIKKTGDSDREDSRSSIKSITESPIVKAPFRSKNLEITNIAEPSINMTNFFSDNKKSLKSTRTSSCNRFNAPERIIQKQTSNSTRNQLSTKEYFDDSNVNKITRTRNCKAIFS